METKKLVLGYIRLYFVNLPTDIIKLCLKYSEEMTCWILNKSKLEQLFFYKRVKLTQNYLCFEAKYSFKCTLTYDNWGYHKTILLHLTPTKRLISEISDPHKMILIFVEIYFIEINVKYKTVEKIRDEAISFNLFSSDLLFPNNNFESTNRLTVKCRIYLFEPFKITHKRNYAIASYYDLGCDPWRIQLFFKSLNINKNITYKWKINNLQLSQCKYSNYFESDKFGDNKCKWLLLFIPYGTKRKYRKKLKFMLKLLSVPYSFIKSFRIQYKITIYKNANNVLLIKYNDIVNNMKKSYHRNLFPGQLALKTTILKNIDSLLICIEIEILNVTMN